MLQKIKNFLKRILPPPVRTFLREIERVLAEIRGQGSKHSREIGVLNSEISALRKGQEEFGRQLRQEQEELSRQLRQEQKEAAYMLSNISEVQKQTVETLAKMQELQQQAYSALSELCAKIENTSAISESEFGRVRKEIEIISQSLDKQDGEFVELRKRAQQHERNIISKIDHEKQELFYEYYSRLKPEDYEKELALWYRKRTGKMLNLSDPKTYNEKIQWLKLYDSTPLKTRLADKYLVRDWVKEKIGEEYLIPLLGVWDSFDEIDFDSLPNQFVLKANHGSGWNIIVKDKATFDKNDARKKFSAWMGKNYAFNLGFELHYMDIPPKIIAEEYISESDDQVRDYKFMCFSGEVKFIWVDSDRYTGHKRTLFTLDWERMDESIGYEPADYEITRPQNLEKMLEFASVLGKGFPHVRVDFYEVSGRLYFGEMTFTSESGIGKTKPAEFDFKMGEWMQTPSNSLSSAIRSKFIY